MLPVPADGGFRGVWLGLDYRSQTIRGQLLFRGVSAGVPAEVPAHPSRTAHQQDRRLPGHRSMLRAPKVVRHFHAVFRRGRKHHLWVAAWHGGEQVWL